MAIITSDAPAEVESQIISKIEFKIIASKSHSLYKKYGSEKSIPIEEVLEYPFVSPDSLVLGKISKSNSIDGFQRNVMSLPQLPKLEIFFLQWRD